MTLTWSIAFIAPWDTIYFGATCLAFGPLLLAAALYLWRRGEAWGERHRTDHARDTGGPDERGRA
jgi:hypothetical protein